MSTYISLPLNPWGWKRFPGPSSPTCGQLRALSASSRCFLLSFFPFSDYCTSLTVFIINSWVFMSIYVPICLLPPCFHTFWMMNLRNRNKNTSNPFPALNNQRSSDPTGRKNPFFYNFPCPFLEGRRDNIQALVFVLTGAWFIPLLLSRVQLSVFVQWNASRKWTGFGNYLWIQIGCFSV